MLVSKISHDGKTYWNIDSEKSNLPSDVIATAIADQRWAEIRARRDALLRECDYAVMPDYPLTAEQKKTVTAYRKALRDLPETFEDPEAVEWPAVPEALTR